MKAVQFDQFGSPDVLTLRDTPAPVAEANEVVVGIRAASIHPADARVRDGTAPGAQKLPLPHILGRDFSGVIEQVGGAVTDFKSGNEVFGVLAAGHEGTYAEKVAIRAELVAKKPAGLSHIEAAALALSGLTALVALEDVAKLGRGQRILIHGGAGGVGGFAVQYAHHVGAEVFATASARNHDYLRGLGADSVIDYNARPFEEAVEDCDVVFDTIGGEVHRRSLAVLKPGGLLIHIAPPPKDMPAPPDGIRIVRPNVGRDRAHMERIAELVAAGALKPPAIETFELADASRAHTVTETGHVRGKLVFRIGEL
jgi:NADPH:quinone reductase-like Zn-dependent oxidoreductase